MKQTQIIGLGVALLLLVPFLSFAAVISISPNLPGSLATTPSGSSPGAFIKNFYSYALFISGFLAFAAIVYGGIQYAIARGNPSGETEAKAWIWSALLGMLLLAGAYLILFTINPNLVNLSLPSLGAIPTSQSNGSVPQITAAQQQAVQQQPCNGVCPGQCQSNNTCSVIVVNPNAGNITPP